MESYPEPFAINIPIRFDAEGFAIPAHETALAWVASWGVDLNGPDETDDELEARAAAGDESDPETWGEEWDAYVWEPNEASSFEPTAADEAALPGLFPDDDLAEAWEDFGRWAERVDALALRAGLEPEHVARSVPGCSHESALI